MYNVYMNNVHNFFTVQWQFSGKLPYAIIIIIVFFVWNILRLFAVEKMSRFFFFLISSDQKKYYKNNIYYRC